MAMEGCSRKHDDDAATVLTEMKYLKKMQHSPADAVESPALERQVLYTTAPISTLVAEEAAEHIKVGSFYELIDQSKLPESTPHQLKSIRVVMVREKTRMRVSIRYPSISSLREHISEGNGTKPHGKKIPMLDEKFVIGAELASELLYRRVPPLEIAERSNFWDFWAVPPLEETEKISSISFNAWPSNEELSLGSCWSELKSMGMVNWGKRRQVRFLSRHVEGKHEQSTFEAAQDKREGKEKSYEEDDDEDQEQSEQAESEEEDEDDVDEEQEEEDEEGEKHRIAKTEKAQTAKKNLKRKRQEYIFRAQRARRAKTEGKNKMVVYKQWQKKSKKKVLKNSIDRWSVERYKLAEKNMLRIMKEKRAFFGKPMLRPALRSEARKLIGDTGLLDHLLKHMSGKVAPGGQERFRRRHNADGAMEYWLESADLVDIRREAGVQDPYWIPPHGWKPGDNPTQDPTCAREIRKLKEEMTIVKKSMRDLVSKKKEEEVQAAVAYPVRCVTDRGLGSDGLLLPLKETYMDLVKRKTKIEKQLMAISQTLTGIEEEMGKLHSTMGETQALLAAT
ncbi:protein DYAD [Tripterygium wilfordii]|uniref:protein DYAD n=1 Tax=Tripterygium wilfordii TaxID=458696 RepID=UPI0018F832A3|nr:protein DYAD [Tripterygium wilfordii]